MVPQRGLRNALAPVHASSFYQEIRRTIVGTSKSGKEEIFLRLSRRPRNLNEMYVSDEVKTEDIESRQHCNVELCVFGGRGAHGLMS